MDIKVGQTIPAAQLQELMGQEAASTPPAAGMHTPVPEVPVGATISAEDLASLSAGAMQGPQPLPEQPDTRSTFAKVKEAVSTPLAADLMKYYPPKPDPEFLEVEWAGNKQLVKAPYQVKQTLWGVGKSVYDNLIGFTSPLNLGLMAAGGAAAVLPKLRATMPAITGLFTAEMIANAPEQVKEAADAIKSGDQGRAAEAVTNLALTGMFIGAAGKHTVKGTMEQFRAKPSKVQSEAAKAVDDLGAHFDELDKLGKEQQPATEPSALSDIDKTERAAAIEQQLSQQEAERQSPQSATGLKQELAQESAAASLGAAEQSLHAGITKWETELPELLKDYTPEERNAIDRMDAQSPIAAELLRRKLASQEISSNDVKFILQAWREDMAAEQMKRKPATPPAKPASNFSTAVEETYSALNELFGGQRIGLQAFSEENYRQAKPHLDAAWQAAQAAGMDFKEFAEKMRARLGDVAVPYLARLQPEVGAVPVTQQQPQKQEPEQPPRTTADIKADPSLPYDPTELADIIYAARGEGEPNRFRYGNKVKQIERYLKGEKIDPETDAEIARAVGEISSERVPNEQALPEMDPDTIILQRKTSDRLPAPAIRKWEFDALRSLKDLPKALFENQVDRPIFMQERMSSAAMPDAAKDLFIRPLDEASYQASQHMKDTVDALHNFQELHKAGLTKSSGERIGLDLISKRQDGAEILRRMGRSVPTLAPDEIAVRDFIRKSYDDLFNQINEARRASGIKPIQYVEDYVTYMRVFDEAARNNGNQVIEDANFYDKYIQPRITDFLPEEKPTFYESARNYLIKPRTTPFRFGKETVRSYRKVKTDVFSIYENYVRLASDHIHKGPAIARMREYMKPFRDSRGEVAFDINTQLPNTARQLDKWLSFSAGINPVGPLGHAVDKVFNNLSSNLGAAMLSANFRSAAIQPTAILNSAVILGKKYTANGIANTMRVFDGAKPFNNIIAESRSLFMREFTDAVDIAFRAAQREGGPVRTTVNTISNAIRKLTRMGFGPLTWADYQTAVSSFYGAFEYATNELGMSRNRARLYADEHVIKTQGSAARHHLSPIQYQALGRAALLFQNFVLNDWNFIRHEVFGKQNVHISDAEVFRRTVNLFAGMAAIGIVYEKLLPAIPGVGPVLAGGSPLPSPVTTAYDEYAKGSSAPKVLAKTAMEFMQLVPGPLNTLRYGTSPGGPVMQFAGDVSKVLSGAPGPRPYTAEVIGTGLGIPGTRQVAKTIRAKTRTDREAKQNRVPPEIRKLRSERAKRAQERAKLREQSQQ